jgi:hypothetical protein
LGKDKPFSIKGRQMGIIATISRFDRSTENA